jgi:hypothetical protein
VVQVDHAAGLAEEVVQADLRKRGWGRNCRSMEERWTEEAVQIVR